MVIYAKYLQYELNKNDRHVGIESMFYQHNNIQCIYVTCAPFESIV